MATLDSTHLHPINLQSTAQFREYELIAKVVAASGPGRTLDWGCGYGQVSCLLKQSGVRVEALDYQHGLPAPITTTLERYPSVVATLTGDPIELPYPDGHFDTALSVGVLEHVEDKDASLDELYRVLRPAGTLWVFKLPNRRSWIEAVAKRTGRYYHGRFASDDVYTVKSARNLLEAHGFRVLSARRANMLPLNRFGARYPRLGGVLWGANRMLARIPGLSAAATNVEIRALRTPLSGGT